MLEKLLSLLLHAKSGAVATVLVLGASGALVTATVDNGMTTITITQANQSDDSAPAVNTVTTPDGTLVTITFSDENDDPTSGADPTSPATGKGCSDEAHERNKWMKEVNVAFKDLHQDVLGLSKDAPRTDESRTLVKDADKDLKDLRQEAVKLINDTFDCDNDEDEDTAEDIAEDFIGQMEDVVAGLEEALEGPEDENSEETTADTSNTNTSNTKQNGKPDSDRPDNSGKGKGRNR
jgi:hypothetical protein